MMDGGKILVTGGAGFIGSAVVWALNRRNLTDILVVDILGRDPEKWKNLVPLRFCDYLEADQLLGQLETGRLKDVTTVFHLGAESATTEADCSYLIRNNYEFTRSLAEWAIAGRRRFVYASSAATYGDGRQGMNETVDLSVLRPLNMYGYSKQLFDLHAQRQGWDRELVGLKYFNVFGPNEYHKREMRSMVCRAFEQIRDSRCVRLFRSYNPEFADGEQKRDFLYVKDAAEMTVHLAMTPSAAGIYNLGSGVARTWIDLAKAVFSSLKVPEKIEFIEMPDSIRGQYQYYTCADVSKLTDSGWTGHGSLEDSIDDYVRNYLVSNSRLGDEGDQRLA
jgi:ADP-L-glycero-D-manno-heptose 6-epimerase